jgi:hypothetical protein
VKCPCQADLATPDCTEQAPNLTKNLNQIQSFAQGMPHLLQLPHELLLCIVESLESDNATLAALCLSSQACAQLSRDLLYRHIRLGYGSAKPIQNALLLRTMFDRKLCTEPDILNPAANQLVRLGPDLATRVKTLEVITSIFTDYSQRLEVPSGAKNMTLTNGKGLEEAAVTQVES